MSAYAIDLKDVSVVRRGHCILTDISVAVEAGTCCAVLGPNGSGKSALVAIIVSHHLGELPRVVAKVVLMNEGRVADQGPLGALLPSVKLSALFGCRVEVFKRNGHFVASVCSVPRGGGQLE